MAPAWHHKCCTSSRPTAQLRKLHPWVSHACALPQPRPPPPNERTAATPPISCHRWLLARAAYPPPYTETHACTHWPTLFAQTEKSHLSVPPWAGCSSQTSQPRLLCFKPLFPRSARYPPTARCRPSLQWPAHAARAAAPVPCLAGRCCSLALSPHARIHAPAPTAHFPSLPPHTCSDPAD